MAGLAAWNRCTSPATCSARTASEFTYTRAFLEASSLGSGGWLVVNRLEGNFPGNVVDLRYEFHVTDGLIVRLVIAP